MAKGTVKWFDYLQGFSSIIPVGLPPTLGMSSDNDGSGTAMVTAAANSDEFRFMSADTNPAALDGGCENIFLHVSTLERALAADADLMSGSSTPAYDFGAHGDPASAVLQDDRLSIEIPVIGLAAIAYAISNDD